MAHPHPHPPHSHPPPLHPPHPHAHAHAHAPPPPPPPPDLAYYPHNSSTSALRAFAHLPSYEFDYDYRGHTIRPSLVHHNNNTFHHSPIVDNFDSYMFPESDSQSSPTDPSVPSEVNTPTYHPSPPSDDDLVGGSAPLDTHHHHHLPHHHTSSPSAGSGGAPTAQLGPVDWIAVDQAQLYNPDGSPLDPAILYTGYSTYIVLIFVPRQAVELCALVYAKLAHLLHQASSRIVFVTAWIPDQATTFLSRFERVAPFPGSIVCDPDAALFSAFGLTRSPLKAFFSTTRVSAPMRQGVRNALSTVTYRAQNRDIGSTAVSSKRLKVGAVVLSSLRGYSKRPNVVYAAEETSLTGVGCYMDVLGACGVNEAFVPDIDVAQLYTRFNSMRATSIKARCADEKEANRLKNSAAAIGPVPGGGVGGGKTRSSRKGDRRNALKS